MAASFKLKPAQRLRRNSDFQAIRRNGRTYRCPYFTLHSLIRAGSGADVSFPRVGISAARRVGTAPQRNLAKRRLRELFRLRQHDILPEADLIFSLRRPCVNASYSDLEQRFLHALKYHGLRRPEADAR